jgi:hypothetical protein
MPWQRMQFERITVQTGPSGLSICGRVARFWAATGVATEADNAATTIATTNPIMAVPNVRFIENSPYDYLNA